ncbi:MAG: helix-turn-helix transcriptional regulator [Solirubrobacteraceae bacterium]|nr:helix-turn-helix transcriptional regulator [Solirubrobacteraceae bacterium]
MTDPSDDPTRPGLLSIGEAAQALGVSLDTLRRWEKAGRISFERDGSRRVIEAAEVASLLRERTATGGRTSARNRMEGIVLSVTRDKVMAQVELACGPFRIVSLMSREAADELGLEPGVKAAAVVKSTNVVVETVR